MADTFPVDPRTGLTQFTPDTDIADREDAQLLASIGKPTFHVTTAATRAARLALTGLAVGDIVMQLDVVRSYQLMATPESTEANWLDLSVVGQHFLGPQPPPIFDIRVPTDAANWTHYKGLAPIPVGGYPTGVFADNRVAWNAALKWGHHALNCDVYDDGDYTHPSSETCVFRFNANGAANNYAQSWTYTFSSPQDLRGMYFRFSYELLDHAQLHELDPAHEITLHASVAAKQAETDGYGDVVLDPRLNYTSDGVCHGKGAVDEIRLFVFDAANRASSWKVAGSHATSVTSPPLIANHTVVGVNMAEGFCDYPHGAGGTDMSAVTKVVIQFSVPTSTAAGTSMTATNGVWGDIAIIPMELGFASCPVFSGGPYLFVGGECRSTQVAFARYVRARWGALTHLYASPSFPESQDTSLQSSDWRQAVDIPTLRLLSQYFPIGLYANRPNCGSPFNSENMSERQWLANIVFSLQWLRSCGIGVGNHIGTPGGALGPNWRTAIAGNACRSIFTSCGPPGGAYQPTTLPHRQVIYQSAFAAWHFDNGSTGWRYILDQTAASQSLAAFWMHSCDHYGVDLGTAETVAWEDAQKTIDYAMGATVDGRTIAKPCKIVSMDDISSGRLE